MRTDERSFTDEQFSKLPKYAQRHIKNLEHIIDEVRMEQRAISEEATGIRWYDPSDRINKPTVYTYLPDRANIEFLHGKRERVAISHHSIDRKFHDSGRIIRVASDWGRLIVVPEASNSITILTEDRLKSTGR